MKRDNRQEIAKAQFELRRIGIESPSLHEMALMDWIAAKRWAFEMAIIDGMTYISITDPAMLNPIAHTKNECRYLALLTALVDFLSVSKGAKV